MKYLFVIVLLLSCATVHKTRYEFRGTANGNSPTSHFIFNSDGYLIEVDSFANDGSKWAQFMQPNCQPSLRLRYDTENTVRPTVVIYPAKKITVDSNYFMHPKLLSVLPAYTDDIRKRLTHTVYDTTKDDSVFFINHKPIPQ